MRKLLLVFLLFGSPVAFGQFNIGVQGAYQIINAVSTLGREAVNAAEYRKSKKEEQAHEAEYMTAIQSADSLFVQEKYTEAAEQYNRALQFRRDEYSMEQIARCNTESTRVTLQKYEALLDTADAEYTKLNYAKAIRYYAKALEIREEEYPRAKIDLAKQNGNVGKRFISVVCLFLIPVSMNFHPKPTTLIRIRISFPRENIRLSINTTWMQSPFRIVPV
ncbi:hypothetical protein [Fluviicola sp.]|uniref:hypothetical protein n=1 Tax=Fluviicola sp. TaxID=1917219 RepID=UPI003D2A88E5